MLNKRTMSDLKNQLKKEGDRVIVKGFGTFEVKKRKPRVCKNPKTGEEFCTEESLVVRFKCSQIFFEGSVPHADEHNTRRS